MRVDPYRLAEMADPVFNRHFSRRWDERRPMSSRDLEHLADLEMALGNPRRADALSWQAAMLRDEGRGAA